MKPERTPLEDFHNRLRILANIEFEELHAVGLRLNLEALAKFQENPWFYFIRCGDASAEKIWSILERRSGVDIRRPLTAAQVDHLIRLSDAGALDRETAVTAHDRTRIVGSLSAMVVGKLVDLGLARKAVRHHTRSQATVYWLTPDGRGVINRRMAA